MCCDKNQKKQRQHEQKRENRKKFFLNRCNSFPMEAYRYPAYVIFHANANLYNSLEQHNSFFHFFFDAHTMCQHCDITNNKQ